ncbi:thiamine phosphate synthase [Aquimarina agarivorans]|uniref:thiamine phosphate synthase n=1 Tax=Aquimarina agarivorans TaxID=980584 RepID=UPI000248EDB8|nr:thiamine phosphate synthase [Aquimarina agarivorans]
MNLPKTYLQYISQGKTITEHLQNIEAVCKSGCKWVQLRLKNVELLDYLNAAKEARKICDTYGAVLIINDNIGVAGESGADGVHVGLTDTNPKEVRKQLGEEAIIGGTANTLEDCLQHIEDGVDYIGLGPFRFTTTKDKLSPILGAKGYSEIVNQIVLKGFQLPVVGIGGITLSDLPELSKTGLSNIAVSGLLTGESELELKQRIEQIEQTFSN